MNQNHIYDRYWAHGCTTSDAVDAYTIKDTEYQAKTQMPTGSKDGDQCYIVQMMDIGTGQLDFSDYADIYTYTWTSQGSDDGDDEWGGLDGGEEQNDIELAQVNNLKLKNKAGNYLSALFCYKKKRRLNKS